MSDPFKKRDIGHTGIKVTQLGLGTGPIGNLFEVVSEENSKQLIQYAIDCGINYIDTAPFYGYGLAEKRVGKYSNHQNNNIVISTKVGRLIRKGKPKESEIYNKSKPFFSSNMDYYSVFDFSYDGILKSYDESLKRLCSDHVDILHIHDPHDFFDQASTSAYKALSYLKTNGKIKVLSAGMNQFQMLSKFIDYCDFDTFLLAGKYTLLDHSAIKEFIPKCERNSISLIIGGVYSSGIIADYKINPRYNYHDAPKQIINKTNNIQNICNKYNISIKSLAIQFPIFHKSVVSVLTGVISLSEMKDNIHQFKQEIPIELWNDLINKQIIDPLCHFR